MYETRKDILVRRKGIQKNQSVTTRGVSLVGQTSQHKYETKTNTKLEPKQVPLIPSKIASTLDVKTA